MGPNETLEVCAPAGFVPKKSKKLRFVIDFTSLNKYIAGTFIHSPALTKYSKRFDMTYGISLALTFPAGTSSCD